MVLSPFAVFFNLLLLKSAGNSIETLGKRIICGIRDCVVYGLDKGGGESCLDFSKACRPSALGPTQHPVQQTDTRTILSPRVKWPGRELEKQHRILPRLKMLEAIILLFCTH